ncbi:PpsA2 [Desulforapulum autotrophicum HRM2]|uniref:PpsA2 n=1 Tax=Desulforapulum autotrophicum (strain ATCC 43914 / DSM 3382 / VKM B-1955 / HRM2) TaxID=177437 RepID=C0QGJ5_DESAH|nr:PEP/pyruvate-binding domain-containing protein [Desulforapulum autotrophicum]ACN13470.1 PpsA2 [Desulforapulum autotrophicum HRM2]
MTRNEKNTKLVSKYHARSNIYREIMTYEIKEVLLISSPYNIFNMEEDGSLASKIINEYSGLNLRYPPVITGASSAREALDLLAEKRFDLVLIVPHLKETDIFSLGREIKVVQPDLRVILLSPSIRALPAGYDSQCVNGIDTIFIWSGNSDLLITLIKNAEDHINVDNDTRLANVRVVILVEDCPEFYSFMLPIIYKEIVTQTQALLATDLNDSMKLLTMRARPKLLLAKNYEQAQALYERYKDFLLCIISDTRFPRNGSLDPEAGIKLFSNIRRQIRGIPLLLMSSERKNSKKADQIPALFLDKNHPNLVHSTRLFFLNHLGFGNFVFCMPNGRNIDIATTLMQLESKLPTIPDESLVYHADRDHFSSWLMARSEIDLALKFRACKSDDFSSPDELRKFIITNIHELRKFKNKGVVSTFNENYFDSDVKEFVKIGQGSLGGKGRGLAFMSGLLEQASDIHKNHPKFRIQIPKTLVLCTDVFEAFITQNNLENFERQKHSVEEVVNVFLRAELPSWLIRQLKKFLSQFKVPLAVRSSSQLEDAHFQPYAGLYKTYKIPNNHPDLSMRICHLANAIKLVFASTYYDDAKAFHRSTSSHPFHDSMAVIVQALAGQQHGDYFYPAVSGVAQSIDYYPFSRMKSEDGIAHIALGLGKTVVDGEKCLRFSPGNPQILPQFSLVDDILKNAQTTFYALKTNDYSDELNFGRYSNLEKRNLDEALEDYPVQVLSSTYIPDENRIRDTWSASGPKLLTFASILKYNSPPLAPLLADLLDLGGKEFGGPVEIEFSVNLYPGQQQPSDFHFLQIRSMAGHEKQQTTHISQQDINAAFCYSSAALGNGIVEDITDIVYVTPQTFSVDATLKIAEEICRINASLVEANRRYLLIGPGRWGGSDRWLGIPVKWHAISGIGAIIELRNEQLNADPSQGSHFFHNITSLGIPYITVNELTRNSQESNPDFIDWTWLEECEAVCETQYLRHVRLSAPILIKMDGKKSRCVIISR